MYDCPHCGDSQHEPSNYCPHCGEQLVQTEIEYPFEVTHYVHERPTREQRQLHWNIDPDDHPDLFERLGYLCYEEQITYQVKEGTIDLVAVNGHPIDYGRLYEYNDDRRKYEP